MAENVARIEAENQDSGIDLEYEASSLRARIRAYNLMGCGKWDHNMEPADFVAIMEGLEMSVDRLHSEICRRGL